MKTWKTIAAGTIIAAMSAMCPSIVVAEDAATTTTATGISFSAESEAVAAYYNDAWTASTSVNELVKVATFGESGQHSLYVVGNEFLVPDEFSAYGGGARFSPDLSNWFDNHTVLPGDSFKVFIEATVGNALYSTTGSSVIQRYGGGVSAAINNSGSVVWKTVTGHYERVGNKNGFDISTGLSFIFGN